MSDRHPRDWTLGEELDHLDAEHGWTEERVDCPVCTKPLPLAGPGGFVRHLLALHPESLMARAIFTRLVEVQLLDAEHVAEIVTADEVRARWDVEEEITR